MTNATLPPHSDPLDLRDVVETIPALVVCALPDGSAEFVNRAWQEYTGYPQQRLSGSGWQGTLHPDDLPKFLDEWSVSLSAGKPFETEARLRHADGQYRWFLVKKALAVSRTRNGKPSLYTLIAFEDINERKQAEQARQEIERELREVIETIPSMAWSAAADGAAEFFNGRWLAYTGLAADQARGWGWTIAVHPEDLNILVDYWRTLVASGQSGEIEARLRRFDGVYRWFLFRATPSLDDNGRVVKWFGTNTDIEERKRAESLLAGEKRILEMVAKGDALSEILDALCRLVEEQANDTLASILLLDGNRLRHGGAPSLPSGYTDAIDGAAIGPSEGSCGTAAYRGRQVIVEDIATDPLWGAYRALALPYSLRACWSTPVFSSQGKVIATFAMYYREPRRPAKRDQEIIEQITHLAGVAIERNLTQEALRSSEQNFRGIVNGVPGLVFTATAEGAIEFVNQRILDYTGRTFEEVKEWATTDLIHPDDLPKVIAAARRSIETGEPQTVEHRLRRADGVYRWFDFSRLAQRDSQGRIVRWYVLLSDIHERKHAEESLRRSESYLAQAQQLARVGSWAWDIPGKNALYVSEEWCRIYGFDPKDGMPSWEQRLQRVHPEDRARFQTHIERAIAEKSDYDLEFRITPPHTPIRFIHSVGEPVLSPSGELLQFVGVAMDVTEGRRAEEERERLRQELANLAHLNRVSTLGELTASLAHEIKQPIGAAVTNAEACLRFLDRNQPDVVEAREAALEMARDARHAADVIDRLRSLYRKGPSHREMVDINEVIGEMVVMLRNEANRYSVTMHTELGEELPKVVADRVQLQQVLMNLMLNGIEAMRETRGNLSIKSQLAEEGQLLISVIDTGLGLPAGDADQIFNAFFTTKPEGSGLGLAITRSIVESHGGRVWATANSGRGTTFQFTLPQTRAAHA
jgi:PAS domain S-box-containing protein